MIEPADRGENGYRDYPAELVDVLRFIERAQDLGFSLKEIASIEVGSGDHIASCTDALPMLSAKLEAITALIEEAKARKERIETLMAEMTARQRETADIGHAFLREWHCV